MDSEIIKYYTELQQKDLDNIINNSTINYKDPKMVQQVTNHLKRISSKKFINIDWEKVTKLKKIDFINNALKKYDCLPVSKNFKMFGPDQDEADAIISVAALKYFSQNKKYWKVHKAAKKEGWIYGVKFINDKV